jgi:hypothetical protein
LGSSCIISGRICLGGQLVRFWTSHQNKTLPMADQSRAPHVQAEASGGLPSVEEVPPAHSVGRGRQTTFSWKKTLETDSETHDRAAERRQNINQGQRFYHARCPPLNCQTPPTSTRATSCSAFAGPVRRGHSHDEDLGRGTHTPWARGILCAPVAKSTRDPHPLVHAPLRRL